ncbi:putative quinol monooxygenase [Xanthobacter sp. TB0139]|uniref:putative quinol monooxygenase n=1 Tax=Xanthobacter sp. TB0139 TaxID=3459178 RepID=UPI004039727C
MLKVVAQFFIQSAKVDTALPLLRELAALSRQEEACIAYDLFVNEEDSGHFTIIETWPDHAALKAHSLTEHFTRLVPQLQGLGRETSKITLMKAVDI